MKYTFIVQDYTIWKSLEKDDVRNCQKALELIDSFGSFDIIQTWIAESLSETILDVEYFRN